MNDWLVRFYSFYMTAIVVTGSGHSLRIEVCRRNQPISSKLELCESLLLVLNSYT